MGFADHTGRTHTTKAQTDANDAFDRVIEKFGLAFDAFTGDDAHKNLVAILAFEEFVDCGSIGAILSKIAPTASAVPIANAQALAPASGLMLGAGSSLLPATASSTPSPELEAGTKLVALVGNNTDEAIGFIEKIMQAGFNNLNEAQSVIDAITPAVGHHQFKDLITFVNQLSTDVVNGSEKVRNAGIGTKKTLESILTAQSNAQTDSTAFYNLASVVLGGNVATTTPMAKVIADATTKMAGNTSLQEVAVALKLLKTATKDEVVTEAKRLATAPALAPSDKGTEILATLANKNGLKNGGNSFTKTDDPRDITTALVEYTRTGMARVKGLRGL